MQLFEACPKASYFICTRDAFNRSVSAYNKSVNVFNLSFKEALEREEQIIKEVGGVRLIFENFNTLILYLSKMKSIHLDHPILLPSVIMINWEKLLPMQGIRYTVVNIEEHYAAGEDASKIDFSALDIQNTSTFSTKVEMSRDEFMTYLGARLESS
jgi:hypothetical protein